MRTALGVELSSPFDTTAVLGSSTLTHLLPAIRVGGLRRGLFISTYEGNYGQYLQELADPNSELFAFQPSVILLALDSFHLMRGIDPAAVAIDAELDQRIVEAAAGRASPAAGAARARR